MSHSSEPTQRKGFRTKIRLDRGRVHVVVTRVSADNDVVRWSGQRGYILRLVLVAVVACASVACSHSGQLACNGTYGGFGAGCPPPPGFMLYGSESPFNQKVPLGTRTRTNSTEIVQTIVQQMASQKYPQKIVVPDSGQGGEPTFWIRSVDPAPMFTIHCTEYACPGVEGIPVSIPAGARPEGGPDHHLIVADQSSNTEYDLWHVAVDVVPATGGPLDVGSAGSLPLNSGEGRETQGNANAAGFGELAGRVRAEEVAKGEIPHALFVVIDCHDGRAVYPAAVSTPPAGGRCDQRSTRIPPKPNLPLGDAPPLGAWLRLSMTDAEVDAPNIPEWEKPYLRAMRDYGMYFGDTGVEGYFAIEAEAGIQYTSLRDANGDPYADPWKIWAMNNQGQNGWSRYEPDKTWVGNFTGVDWLSKLEVLCHPRDTTPQCAP